LRARGFRIAVDDFGTGHSSLAYLKDFPIHKLKLDRAFIKDLPGDSAGMQIAEAVIRLGHSLGLTVLAEGVETEAQADFLAHAGCRYAQGYLFAQPMWEEDLLTFLGSAQSVAG
jgi:EAL domain-containing protein (putative c-di-GMP-specific phosphodiesterase class I)